MGEALDRNDQVSVRMLMAMRQDPILHLEEVNRLSLDRRDSLEEVFDKVAARYREMTSQGECDVFSLVCGWNGFGFEGKTFYINSQFGEESQITDVRPEHAKDAKLISCGDNRHYDNFLAGVYKYGADVRGLQRAFRDTLAQGVMFDEFIDTNAQFEVIRRPE